VNRIAGIATLLCAFVAVVGLSGCKKYPQCRKTKDCHAGETCVGGVCQNCTSDAECIDDTPAGQPAWTCKAFRCGPAGPDGGGAGAQAGEPCTQRLDCAAGLACKAGVCASCTEDADCDAAGCDLESGRCKSSGPCETDEQCAMDEICDGGLCVFSGDLGDEGGPCGLAAVYFGFDSDELTPETRGQLDGLASCLTEHGIGIFLEAHADDRGTEEYNIMLTERRGRQVAGYLAEKGVAEGLLQVIAKGDLEATGKDETARSKERRVQFLWPDVPGAPQNEPASDDPTSSEPSAPPAE
jgi:hypothetical protein